MFDFKKLKALFSGLKKTGGEKAAAGDFRDTTTRAAVDAIVSEIVERIPKKYITAMSKDQARLVSLVAVLTGYVMRKVTPFGTFGDSIITDLAQGIANRIMGEYNEEVNNPNKVKDLQLRKTKLILIAKVFLNSASYAKDLSPNKLLSDFNEMMEELPEENQNELVDALSGFNKTELIEFMKCSKEEKKLFFSYLFTKVPEKKVEEESSDWDDVKKWLSDTKTSLEGTLEKADELFADDRLGGYILNKIFNLK